MKIVHCSLHRPWNRVLLQQKQILANSYYCQALT